MPSVYEIITDRIIDRIKSGSLNWRKTWNMAPPMNYVSNKPYSGVNFFMLSGEGSPYWLTFKQAKEQGGSVKKGARGFPVCFFKPKVTVNEETGEEKKSVMFRYYTVFNSSQCEGLPEKIAPGPVIRPREDIEKLVATHNPKLSRGSPAYCPSKDEIFMPGKTEFDNVDWYWRIFFHELTHWTGHETRLAREGVMKVSLFGSETYSKEELVAELGSAFLSSRFGLESQEEQEASYIQSWIQPLKEDPTMIVQAAARASKAVEFIAGSTE